jgi:hypothetical protein
MTNVPTSTNPRPTLYKSSKVLQTNDLPNLTNLTLPFRGLRQTQAYTVYTLSVALFYSIYLSKVGKVGQVGSRSYKSFTLNNLDDTLPTASFALDPTLGLVTDPVPTLSLCNARPAPRSHSERNPDPGPCALDTAQYQPQTQLQICISLLLNPKLSRRKRSCQFRRVVLQNRNVPVPNSSGRVRFWDCRGGAAFRRAARAGCPRVALRCRPTSSSTVCRFAATGS